MPLRVAQIENQQFDEWPSEGCCGQLRDLEVLSMGANVNLRSIPANAFTHNKLYRLHM